MNRVYLFPLLVLLNMLLACSQQQVQPVQIIPLSESNYSTHITGMFFDHLPLKHSFRLHNSTQDKITNIKIATSCGCTVVNTITTELAPGQSMPIKIEVDLTGKRGEVSKTLVISYDSVGKSTSMEYQFTFQVKKDVTAHQSGNLQEKLFKGKCATCHAVPAQNLMGEQLYRAVCASCHGENAQGGAAKGFNTPEYLKMFNPEKTYTIISDGYGDTMPGFSKKIGGPLTHQQIDSLIDWFEAKRQKWKKYVDKWEGRKRQKL